MRTRFVCHRWVQVIYWYRQVSNQGKGLLQLGEKNAKTVWNCQKVIFNINKLLFKETGCPFFIDLRLKQFSSFPTPPPPNLTKFPREKRAPLSKQIDLLWQRVNLFPLMLRTSTFKSLYGGKITISTQLI